MKIELSYGLPSDACVKATKFLLKERAAECIVELVVDVALPVEKNGSSFAASFYVFCMMIHSEAS